MTNQKKQLYNKIAEIINSIRNVLKLILRNVNINEDKTTKSHQDVYSENGKPHE